MALKSKETSSWGYFILILFISIGSFWGFKQVLPEKIFTETALLDEEHISTDEWMREAMKNDADSLALEVDSLKTTKKEISKDSILTEKESPIEIHQEESFDEGFYLTHFYERLYQLLQDPNNTKVRIAYFGDSMTDGDLIVQDIRQKLQDRFGGRGIGFVPVMSESAATRASIKHSFSNNWQEYTFMKKYEEPHPYGISGSVYYAVDSVGPQSLSFSKGVNHKNNLMPNPVLFYGYSTNDSAVVKMIANGDTIKYPLKPHQRLNTLALSSGLLSELDLTFEKADSIPFYGVNFDVAQGIQVDDFSMRGNSGLPLPQLRAALMQSFQKELGYDLVVLHFGTNVMSSNSFAYGWYGDRMGRVVDHLRRVFPETSVMVVSIADRSKKYGTEMKTDSAVNYLLAAQKKYAKQKKTGFVNLYALMGGEDSMVDWAEQEPPLANKDYTHFSPLGAKKVAQMITQEILNGFEEFKVKKEKELKEQEKEREKAADSLENQEEELELMEEKDEVINDTKDEDL